MNKSIDYFRSLIPDDCSVDHIRGLFMKNTHDPPDELIEAIISLTNKEISSRIRCGFSKKIRIMGHDAKTKVSMPINDKVLGVAFTIVARLYEERGWIAKAKKVSNEWEYDRYLMVKLPKQRK